MWTVGPASITRHWVFPPRAHGVIPPARGPLGWQAPRREHRGGCDQGTDARKAPAPAGVQPGHGGSRAACRGVFPLLTDSGVILHVAAVTWPHCNTAALKKVFRNLTD